MIALLSFAPVRCADAAGCDVGTERRLPLRGQLVADTAAGDSRGNGKRETVDV